MKFDSYHNHHLQTVKKLWKLLDNDLLDRGA